MRHAPPLYFFEKICYTIYRKDKKGEKVMGYRLARTYEEKGYNIIESSIYEKNGKLYGDAQSPCWKCGGTGRLNYFLHIDNGVCFSCGGAGYFSKSDCRVYTEEEREKMDKAAEAKKQRELDKKKAEAPAKIQAWKDKYNIPDGELFIVAGCNSYEIKDELKAQGAKYYNGLGWFFGTQTAPNEMIADGEFLYHTSIEDLMYWNDYGDGPYFKENALMDMKANIINEISKKNSESSTSQHVGEIKERLRNMNGTFVSAKCISNEYGSSILYTFKVDGNIFTWFTQAGIDPEIEEGDPIILTGTVKNHTEYQGVLQTQLNRCIVKKRGA